MSLRRIKTEGASGAPSAASATLQKRASKRWRRCNLCPEEFQPHSVFDRYCSTCKHESELPKFSKWLPELDAAICERLSA